MRSEGSRFLLQLAPGCDAQAVLHLALATGPLREFRRDEPGLGELIRSVVRGGGATNRLGTVALVVGRESTERLRSKAFWIVSVAMPLMLVLLIVSP